jgi:hypothetical protein
MYAPAHTSKSCTEANQRPPERVVGLDAISRLSVEMKQPVARQDVKVDRAIAPWELVAEDAFDLPRARLRPGAERRHVAAERPPESLPDLESEAPAEERIGELRRVVEIGGLLNDANVRICSC